MAKRTKAKTKGKDVATLTHDEAKRRNIPTAEYQSLLAQEEKSPIQVAYERRNRDLDPQLVWRGKDLQDWSDLVVPAPPLFIQEKVHPKVLVDDLIRRSVRRREEAERDEPDVQTDLFADFNGLAEEAAKTEFYQHDANWSNRMILGDSLQVMASLAEREGLRGKVQCIYIDPPYGIKFNSNFQWSTTSRDVTDGKVEHITREPEQVKAFRDTWRDGIHSYLTYLRDRLLVAHDLLKDSGSIFVQIGDENVHLVRSLLDEVFGAENFVAMVTLTKTTSATHEFLAGIADFILWFARSRGSCKYRQLYHQKEAGGDGSGHYGLIASRDGAIRRATTRERKGEVPADASLATADQLQSTGSHGSAKGPGATSWFTVACQGREFSPTHQSIWKTSELGMSRLDRSGRLVPQRSSLRYLRRIDDFPAYVVNNVWADIGGAPEKRFVVETNPRVVERCLLMASDPGDLVVDPTCGSGTTAYVAEQWARRWITIDTSRVALALARGRLMGSRYPYYLLKDSRIGQRREAEITRSEPTSSPVRGDIRQGFVYERVPHIMLKDIANNAEIDVIWERFQGRLEPLREKLNVVLSESWEEWEIPRGTAEAWPVEAKKLHAEWWKQRIARQKEIDASIAAKADYELLYDKPYEDRATVRVAGPFTVESVSPHRTLGVDENDELIDPNAPRGQSLAEKRLGYAAKQDFASMMLEHLEVAGVQQAHKEDRISFASITPWPGEYVCAEGRYLEGVDPDDQDSGTERRAGIFLGPEFGTVSRTDLVAAARESAEAGFDVLIACAFSYDAHATEFSKLGRVAVLKARMNADLHMAEDLKNTGKGNLFVIFGEPDIAILDPAPDEEAEDGQIQVKIRGVDVFHPNTGEIRSDGPEGIACWFIDTDYNEESFFVRQAYFLGAGDPYKSLKTTLRAEIDQEAWDSLNRDVSRPFDRPASGRIAVKVINHLGDEVMKVFRV